MNRHYFIVIAMLLISMASAQEWTTPKSIDLIISKNNDKIEYDLLVSHDQSTSNKHLIIPIMIYDELEIMWDSKAISEINAVDYCKKLQLKIISNYLFMTLLSYSIIVTLVLLVLVTTKSMSIQKYICSSVVILIITAGIMYNANFSHMNIDAYYTGTSERNYSNMASKANNITIASSLYIRDKYLNIEILEDYLNSSYKFLVIEKSNADTISIILQGKYDESTINLFPFSYFTNHGRMTANICVQYIFPFSSDLSKSILKHRSYLYHYAENNCISFFNVAQFKDGDILNSSKQHFNSGEKVQYFAYMLDHLSSIEITNYTIILYFILSLLSCMIAYYFTIPDVKNKFTFLLCETVYPFGSLLYALLVMNRKENNDRMYIYVCIKSALIFLVCICVALALH